MFGPAVCEDVAGQHDPRLVRSRSSLGCGPVHRLCRGVAVGASSLFCGRKSCQSMEGPNWEACERLPELGFVDFAAACGQPEPVGCLFEQVAFVCPVHDERAGEDITKCVSVFGAVDNIEVAGGLDGRHQVHAEAC